MKWRVHGISDKQLSEGISVVTNIIEPVDIIEERYRQWIYMARS